MSVGVVTNTEIEDATPGRHGGAYPPAAPTTTTSSRMFFAVQPDVIMGGGSPNFLAKSTPGSKRTDEDDYIKKFEDAGYTFVATNDRAEGGARRHDTKLLGLFNTGNIDGALDRFFLKKGTVAKFPDQPDLTDQVRPRSTCCRRTTRASC